MLAKRTVMLTYMNKATHFQLDDHTGDVAANLEDTRTDKIVRPFLVSEAYSIDLCRTLCLFLFLSIKHLQNPVCTRLAYQIEVMVLRIRRFNRPK